MRRITIHSPRIEIEAMYQKYRNVKTESFDHKIFDSKAECTRYHMLVAESQAGKVRNLRTQVQFPIIVNSKLICKYIADFAYERLMPDGAWREVVEDVKGQRNTAVFNLKKKLMKIVNGVEIEEFRF